ncbi:FAD-dependent oxidoreductase [Clostridium sp. BNL1100]|uniref:FAD-dependent oxidoreductase n=1 Tax=Clostridium sp. BNL1100 TaxID=755731 RepID=UPI00024A7110|nr:FAD-dependent oxidoreductase [Clostridium sp. BNL1100]AEY65042.1 FAD dependent oxidoreductase [Clostridium sp. BNL1100]
MPQNLIEKAFSRPVESYWIGSTPKTEYPELNENIKTDILVVGGGITGIATAYLLQKEGLDVVIIDANRIVHSTSGHTTAKITSLHSVKYAKLIKQLGEEGAAKYGEINEKAISMIEDIIKENDIQCDFSRQPNFVYTKEEQYINVIEEEVNAAKSIGLPARFEASLPLPFAVQGAVCFDNQAQFHPRKYLLSLADIFVKNGGHIFENTVALDIHEDRECTTSTRSGFSIKSDKVIVASHFPFYDGWGFYSARMYAERSYALAVKSPVIVPYGMYISYEEPTRSIRTQPAEDGNQLLILSGEHHKTGEDKNEKEHYTNLINFAETDFHATDVPYRWSAQDYTVMNEIPFIGHITGKKMNIFVATGFQKWGMTTSHVSAMIIRDIIANGKSEVENIFTPSRFTPVSSAKNFIKENADVVDNLVSGKLESPPIEFTLQPGEGKAVKYHGKKAGAYMDNDGNVFIIDTTCKHLGCEVNWNSAEKTWDCPCHASRYSYDGTVVEGPAMKPLDRLK